MNKLEFVVNSLFENNAASKINGFAKYEKVTAFYTANKIPFPVSLTFVETKNAARLTKDETITIQRAYIAELKSGNVTPETENNFNAMGREGEKVTFSNTVVFSECCKVVGYSATAAKLVESLSPKQLEDYQKTTRNGNALFSISEIPAIIEMLTKIAETPEKVTK